MTIQSQRIIRKPATCDKTGLSGSALEREVRAGRFPAPVKLIEGGRSVGWIEADVDRWIASRPHAQQLAA